MTMAMTRLITVVIAVALIGAAPSRAYALQETPAGELRITLDRLLSEHAFLTVQAMHAGVTDDDQFAAAATALEGNTSDLVAAITAVYGPEAGTAFGDLWRSHIGYVVDYTRGHADGDEDAANRAEEGMRAYQTEFAQFLAGANPNLSAQTLTELLEDHLGQLQEVAHLQTGDYEAVYEGARVAHQHMFGLGDGLAQAIAEQFPDRFTGRGFAFGPAMDLRIALDQLLGEHAFLATEVMRLADTGQDAESAAASALATNGEAIASALEDLYGTEAAAQFKSVWEQHNGHYVDYVRARLADDQDGARQAEAALGEFAGVASDFLASAAGLDDPGPVNSGLVLHTEHLVAQVDAYLSQDFDEAFAITREAYQHMGSLSDILATGIANQFPERFLPDTALAPGAENDAALIGTALTMLAAVLVSRRNRRAVRTSG
jgi:hypothetical protein